jgi:hypothetical protein
MAEKCRFVVSCLLLCILTNASVGQRATSASATPEPEALAKTLDDLIVNLPKWRALVAVVDVEALPIQYKDGKAIEYLRATSLEQLDKTGKLASSVKQKPTAADSVQLLLDLEDLYGGSLHDLASALMLAPGKDGNSIGQAVSWGNSLNDTSMSILETEKRIEIPVMRMLMARDALLDVCKDKLAH